MPVVLLESTVPLKHQNLLRLAVETDEAAAEILYESDDLRPEFLQQQRMDYIVQIRQIPVYNTMYLYESISTVSA